MLATRLITLSLFKQNSRYHDASISRCFDVDGSSVFMQRVALQSGHRHLQDGRSGPLPRRY